MAEKTATVIAESPDQTSFDSGWDDPEFGDKKETKDTPLEEKVETDPPAVETKPPAVETDPPAVEDPPAAAKDKPTDYKPDFDRILGKVEEYKTETKAEIKSEVERIMGVGRTAGKGKAAEDPSETKPSQVQKLDEVAISSELGDLDSLDPDVAKGVKAVVKQLVGHANKQQEVIDSLRVGAKKRDVQDENTASLQKRIDTVEVAHPDAVKLTMTKPFTDWLDKSPLANRVFTTSEEPQAIIDVISEYKKANPPATTTSVAEVKPAIEDEDPKVKARREAAETIVSKGKKAETSPPRSLGEEEGFNQGWDDPEFADEDKTRKSEGRVW